MQISIVNGSVEYDGNPILTSVDFVIHEKEKIALVGRNGCGKTTLLKALSGEVELIRGQSDNTFGFYKSGNPVIGFLKQSTNISPNRTMEDEILGAYIEITKCEKDMEKVLDKMHTEATEQDAHMYSMLQEKYERLGGYDYKREYKTAVRRFGFSEEDMKKPLNNFSGGQRTKISLLALLLSKPDVLLLDEPTNHLDLEAIEWLEGYLKEYKKSFVIVSHDRMFLDKTVNTVYEIEYGEAKRYSGNYTSFMHEKTVAYEKALKDSIAKKKEIERLNAIVERFRYKPTKASMAQSKLKMIQRMGEAVTPLGANNSTFRTDFMPTEETVEKAVVIDNLVFGYSYDKPLGKVNTIIKRGSKVGVIGSNGTGKSTFVKTVMKLMQPLEGDARFGLHANVGYFDQTLTQSFEDITVFEDFSRQFPQLTDTQVRSSLGAFLFTGDDVFKLVKDLSGGEKVRLALCKIFKRKPNILILDEPTNHMDIIGKETLENILLNYPGTVITVSHDRYFINKICDRLIVFEGGGVNIYDGTYKEYEEELSKREKPEENSPVKKKEPVKKAGYESKEKEKNKKLHRIGVLEEKIAVIDAKISEIREKTENDEEIYSDYTKVCALQEEIEKLELEEAPLLQEWEKLSEEVINLSE